VKARPQPTPPQPDLQRRPEGPFGWLDAELVRGNWLREVGPHAAAVLVLLAIAADRRGVSFYGRDSMAVVLGLTRHELDGALQRLLDAGLVAHRPWRPGRADGVWQLLPVPPRQEVRRSGRVTSIAEALQRLGFAPPTRQTAE